MLNRLPGLARRGKSFAEMNQPLRPGRMRTVATSSSSGASFISAPGGRLTLTTATPVLTSTVSAATTIYYTQYVHQYVPIYNGTSFTMTDIGGELSQATTDTTKSPAAATTNSNYDLFVWNDSGTYRCTRGPAWTSDTARGTGVGTTELTRVNGVYLNANSITNGPAASRGTYVGTVRTNGSSQVDFVFPTQSATPTAGLFGVWNAYNRVKTAFCVGDTTGSWTYGTATTWRSSNANTSFRVSILRGLDDDAIALLYSTAMRHSGAGSSAIAGIGIDSTTANSALAMGGFNSPVAGTGAMPCFATYNARPGIGWHYYQAIEYTTAATMTNFGTLSSVATTGLTGVYLA